MTDPELEGMLKAAKEPRFDPGYVENFPRQVRARLRSPWPQPQGRPKAFFRPRLAWAGGFALACLAVFFVLARWPDARRMDTASDLVANVKLVHETLTMFPNQVRAIVRDEHGLHLLLSDKTDVPSSTPLYLHVYNGRDWVSIVTFSGQEVQVYGEKLTVLSDAQGGVIVEGNKFAWSSRQSAAAENGLVIQARDLGTAAM